MGEAEVSIGEKVVAMEVWPERFLYEQTLGQVTEDLQASDFGKALLSAWNEETRISADFSREDHKDLYLLAKNEKILAAARSIIEKAQKANNRPENIAKTAATMQELFRFFLDKVVRTYYPSRISREKKVKTAEEGGGTSYVEKAPGSYTADEAFSHERRLNFTNELEAQCLAFLTHLFACTLAPNNEVAKISRGAEEALTEAVKVD